MCLAACTSSAESSMCSTQEQPTEPSLGCTTVSFVNEPSLKRTASSRVQDESLGNTVGSCASVDAKMVDFVD